MVGKVYMPILLSAGGEFITANAQHLFGDIKGVDMPHAWCEETSQSSRTRSEVQYEAIFEGNDLTQGLENIPLMILARDQGFILSPSVL